MSLVVIAGLASDTALAQSKTCLPPAYLDPDVAVTEESHHHPTFAIVLFKRNDSGAGLVHDVENILMPPAGLGIDHPAIARTTNHTATRYRRVHAHDGKGRLHVEQAPGTALRICHLITLWQMHPDWPNALDRMDAWPSAHIRVGDAYMRNTPMTDVLNAPLTHDRPVILFLEAPTAL